jgi:hypothetical protein
MCPKCWKALSLCDECSQNAARYPEPSPFTLTCGTSTGYTMQAEPGRYNVVVMPSTGMLLSTGCTPGVVLSTR